MGCHLKARVPYQHNCDQGKGSATQHPDTSVEMGLMLAFTLDALVSNVQALVECAVLLDPVCVMKVILSLPNDPGEHEGQCIDG